MTPNLDVLPFTPKQKQFVQEANAKFNLAHGSVRAGKTVGVLFKFFLEVSICPGNMIWMLGNTFKDVYDNCISVVLNAERNNPLFMFQPHLTWHKSGQLDFFDKTINVLGARDERALGKIQGKTMDLCYCNEMTLYPDSVLNMLISRLSMPHSKLYADMNPSYPDHFCKKMIDLAKDNPDLYYQNHWVIEDNIYLDKAVKESIRQTMTGLFYRRFYLGEWCLAEGAIFDFFDTKIHVDKQQKSADFWIAGVDYGTSNSFACVVIGIKEKKYLNDTAYGQVQAEYYYTGKNSRSKTNSEYADDLEELFKKYPPSRIYLDPSAASFKTELRQRRLPVFDTDNDVLPGITLMTDLISRGDVSIHQGCVNLIKEVQGYCWDEKASKRGEDKPIKQKDHAVDALRYALKGYMGNRSSLQNFSAVNKNNPNFGITLGSSPFDSQSTAIPGTQWRM